MGMKILHLSDTHLGYSELDRVNDRGVNCREADFYDAFARAVDMALELRPDAVVHTGDFFHRPSPANRPLIEGMAGLRRLSDAGIPVVMIAGNHSTPRTVYTSPILKALRSVPGVHPVFEQRYERVELDGAVFHGVPHVNDECEYARELLRAEPVPGRLNVLMMHTSVGKGFLMEEYGERVLDEALLDGFGGFDYTALGHWHNFQRVKQIGNAWYAGSTERLSDREAGTSKGCALAEIGEKAARVKFLPIDTRPWLRFDVRECSGRGVEEIRKEISTGAEAEHGGAIVSVYLHDLLPDQGAGIANAWIAARFPGALCVLVRRVYRAGRVHWEDAGAPSQRLEDMFAAYLSKEVADEAERARIEALAAKYFHRDETEGRES